MTEVSLADRFESELGVRQVMDKVAQIQLELYQKAFNDRTKRFRKLKKYLVMDEFLYAAWENVCKGTRSAGVDSISVADIKKTGVDEFLQSLKEDIKENRYEPDRILKHEILKPNGKVRKLGILTVKDRVVQYNMKLVLEPIFEADFDSSSFGFRANRSAQLASLEVYKWLEAGNHYVFKSDISQCFDNIPHELLMKRIKTRIKDRQVRRIIRAWLNVNSACLLNEEATYGKDKGILQGGIISPLLLNIYLDQFDDERENIGLKSIRSDGQGHLVRYADDFVILSKQPIDTKPVEGSLKKIGLELNPEKTYQTHIEDGFEFLGFYFKGAFVEDRYKGKIDIYPTEGSIERVLDSIRTMTDPMNGNTKPPVETIQEINKSIDSWLNYYHHTDCNSGLQRMNDSYSDYLYKYVTNYQN